MKKKIILFLIIVFILLIVGIYVYFVQLKNVTNNIRKENAKTVFSIDKITYFSSASAEIEVSNNTNFNNLFQYTDIALFINNKNSSEIFNAENTLKELYISNIKFNTLPVLGEPNLYYKNINDFATNKYNNENIIQNNLYFSISSEENIDYNLPVLYNNCANPITLCYVNSNIINNYSVSNSTNTFYNDGSLLKHSNILLSSLKCTFSFDIFIVNNLNEKFKTTVNINIPLQDTTSSIYNGNFILEDNVNFIFENYN